MSASRPLAYRRRISGLLMADAPTNTLVPKYSDGSRWIVPFVREDIFFTFQFVPPNITSVLNSRSPTHQDPHSTGT
jgi:hypothetical protein